MTPPLGNGLAVVIDDHYDVALLAAAWLTHQLHVEPLTAGPTTYLDLPWERVSVAIVDLMMSPVSGIEILAWLVEEHPSVRRIAWSAAEDMLRRLPEGLAHAAVGKPSLDTLIEAVRGYV